MENKIYCLNMECMSCENVKLEFDLIHWNKDIVLVKCNKCKYNLFRYKLENEKINTIPLY